MKANCVLLDTCYSDYFTGSSCEVAAVSLYKGMTYGDVLKGLLDEFQVIGTEWSQNQYKAAKKAAKDCFVGNLEKVFEVTENFEETDDLFAYFEISFKK